MNFTKGKSVREAFGECLAELGGQYPDIVVVDGDVGNSTRTELFGKKYPDRFFEVGIAESNMVGIAAGLAASGKRAWLSSFATFVMCNAYDQLRMSVAFPNLDVKIVGTHAGISIGEDGPSQMGIEDVGLACSLPNVTVVVPADEPSTKAAMHALAKMTTPAYLRAGRPNVPIVYPKECNFQLGKANQLRDGKDLTIIANGLLVAPALEAAEQLAASGKQARVLDMHTVKPIDDAAVLAAAKETGRIVVAEEHLLHGGLGSAVAMSAARQHPVPMRFVGIKDTFAESGTPEELIKKYGLTAADILAAARELLQRGVHLLDQLQLLIRSGHPIISVETLEEDRATLFVRKAAEQLGYPLFEWSITTGFERTVPDFAETGVKRGKATDALDYVDNKGLREIYLLKDLAPHCREPLIQRQLLDINARKKVHVILIDHTPLPEVVKRLAVPVVLPLPTDTEMETLVRDTYRRIIRESYSDHTASISRQDMDQLVQTLRGLTALEATRIVSMAINYDEKFCIEDLPHIVEAKRNLLRSAGCLETIMANVRPNEVGGLDNLKKWLRKRRGGITRKGREFGLDTPRGIFLLGVQGCGKSLCAKVVASDWNMPLLRMDPGLLYQKYVGESENRLREALNQAEAMAPAVLWIDEIEKAFASASADSADGGLSQRMFGTLLTWMQDHISPIFMVATANNISALPPELMRKGRFDEVFFVDLPTVTVREQVIGIHLQRRKRDPAKFRLYELATAAEGFSGAELEQVISSALYTAFAAGHELTDEDIFAEIQQTRPLSVLMAERIRELRAWAEGRCVPAD